MQIPRISENDSSATYSDCNDARSAQEKVTRPNLPEKLVDRIHTANTGNAEPWTKYIAAALFESPLTLGLGLCLTHEHAKRALFGPMG